MGSRTAEAIIAAYKKAHFRVHKVYPTIVLYSRVGGWYDLSCPELGHKVPSKAKLGDLVQMTAALSPKKVTDEAKQETVGMTQ